jgi:hypothetical protein
MKEKRILNVLGQVDEKFIAEAAPGKTISRKPTWGKWGVMAACLCLVVVGSFLFNLRSSPDFNSMIGKGIVDTTATVTSIPVDEWMAWYEQMDISGSKLERYVGNEYLKTEAVVWYFPDGVNNLKYLIRKDTDNSLTLWRFASLETEEDEAYTYGDVLSIIYGVESAEDIVSITSAASKGNNTDLGQKIQKEVGTHTYSDREDIAAFYDIVKNVVCFGDDSESVADQNRFTYSFSTDSEDKLTSGESTYVTRSLTVTLENGTTIDGWQYDALSGSFFEYGGIFTQPLPDESVYTLNQIFGIE